MKIDLPKCVVCENKIQIERLSVSNVTCSKSCALVYREKNLGYQRKKWRKKKRMARCSICKRAEEILLYYGKPVCLKCWNKHCIKGLDLKEELKIR